MEEKENEVIVEETTEKEEVKTEESNIFRLYEMSDAIDASMANIKEVTEKQNQLIEILKNVNNEELKELIDSLTSQVEYMNTQYKELEARKVELTYAIDASKDNEEIKTLIDRLLAGLGIFKN